MSAFSKPHRGGGEAREKQPPSQEKWPVWRQRPVPTPQNQPGPRPSPARRSAPIFSPFPLNLPPGRPPFPSAPRSRLSAGDNPPGIALHPRRGRRQQRRDLCEISRAWDSNPHNASLRQTPQCAKSPLAKPPLRGKPIASRLLVRGRRPLYTAGEAGDACCRRRASPQPPPPRSQPGRAMNLG